MSPSWVYGALSAGLIEYHQVGRKKLVSDDNIADYMREAARRAQGKPQERAPKAAKRQNRLPAAEAKSRPTRPSAVGDVPQADPTASRKYRPHTAA
jgi:hypothetical protein